ncbi:MAG: hypothetical protein IT445_15700 [Phycisphaeraceae bacterium]|nr:hypothetical protein [Phycisphaeraceae bacterium]
MMRTMALLLLLLHGLAAVGCQRTAEAAPPLPAWAAAFDSPRQVQDFEDAVTAYFDSVCIAIALHDGWVVPRDGQGQTQFSLSDIARRCADESRDHWPRLLAEHFKEVRQELYQQQRYAGLARDYAWAKKHLALRLFDQEAFDKQAANMRLVYRVDLPGTYTVLSLDLPATTMSVDRQTMAGWGVGHDRLFDLAMDNVTAMPHTTAQWINLSQRTRVFTLRGMPYSSALALRLERFPNAIGRYGAIVAVPVRDYLAVLPIEDASVALSMHDMLVLAWGMAQEGPNTVTGRFYWYRDGVFRELPYRVNDGGIDFSPPDEFVRLLYDLSGLARAEGAGS